MTFQRSAGSRMHAIPVIGAKLKRTSCAFRAARTRPLRRASNLAQRMSSRVWRTWSTKRAMAGVVAIERPTPRGDSETRRASRIGVGASLRGFRVTKPMLSGRTHRPGFKIKFVRPHGPRLSAPSTCVIGPRECERYGAVLRELSLNPVPEVFEALAQNRPGYLKVFIYPDGDGRNGRKDPVVTVLSQFEPRVRQTAAKGRRCAALRSTRPRQSCAAAMRCLEFPPPTAVLPSTSRRRRNEGARAPVCDVLLGQSTRCEPRAPRRNDHGRRGRSNASPALRDRYRANW